MATSLGSTSSPGGAAHFAATRWSMVLAAVDHRAGTESRRALEDLARIYWFPLYAYVCRQGNTSDAAEDMTQEFFACLLEKDGLATVDQSKGKFRSFLLAALKHFLSNQRGKARAQKRGGGKAPLALDQLDAEARYALEPADTMTPDRLFERRWALAVLDQVLARLRQDYLSRDQGKLFEALKHALTGTADGPGYVHVAEQLKMTEGAVKVAAHRLRRRYRELLRDEISQTVIAPELVDEEIAYLLRCL